jgi:hypothetical protein
MPNTAWQYGRVGKLLTGFGGAAALNAQILIAHQ